MEHESVCCWLHIDSPIGSAGDSRQADSSVCAHELMR